MLKKDHQVVVFGGGCFWCTEAVFKMLKGIVSAEPGYSGGSKENPTNEDAYSGATGHAEVVKIEYDPKIISFEDLLTVFFATHDPTTKNRQGNDVGEQYRSIILYTTEEQKRAAEKFIDQLNKSDKMGAPIVTEVKKMEKFYVAEDYHKNYYENNKNQMYCEVVINPKLAKVQKEFANLLKSQN